MPPPSTKTKVRKLGGACSEPKAAARDRLEEQARDEFATALGRSDAGAARRIARRYVRLDPQLEPSDLESRLWETCAAYAFMLPTIDDRIALRRETRIAFDHSGAAVALLTLQAWAKTHRLAHKLAEARLGDLTCEHAIVDHAASFDPMMVARLRRWLVEHDIPRPAADVVSFARRAG